MHRSVQGQGLLETGVCGIVLAELHLMAGLGQRYFGLPAWLASSSGAPFQLLDQGRLGLVVAHSTLEDNLAAEDFADQVCVVERMGQLIELHQVGLLRTALAAPLVDRFAQGQQIKPHAWSGCQIQGAGEIGERLLVGVDRQCAFGRAQVIAGGRRRLITTIEVQRQVARQVVKSRGIELRHDAPDPPVAAHTLRLGDTVV